MILLTHYVDLDGIAPIILSKHYGIEFEQIFMFPYEDKMEENIINTTTPYMNQDVIVTDLNTNDRLYNHYSQFKSFKIYDHHLGTKDLSNKSNVIVDTNCCGTYLFYKEFDKFKILERTPIVNHFVDLVNTYDMWKSDSELWDEAVNLNMVLWSSQDWNAPEDWTRFKMFINFQLHKLKELNEWMWTPFEKDKINRGRFKLNESIKKAKENLTIRIDEEGRKFGIYFGSKQISLVCHDILSTSDLEYVVNINTYQKGIPEAVNGKISVRSKNFDITRLRGINGHKLAGGGMYTDDFLTKLWNGDINNIPYKKERVIGTVHTKKE